MRIFLSHASQDNDAAEQIYLTLINARHEVFFDGAVVKAGDDFNIRIQEHIEKCQLFIFLISPDSIAKTSYALSELKLARQKWQHPQGHVLPVIIRKTPYDLIPPYLQAVSILEPEGNAAAEVGQQVAGWQKRHRRSTKRPVLIMLAVLLISSAIAFLILNYRKHPAVSVMSPAPASSPQPTNREGFPSPTPASNNAAGTAATSNPGRVQTTSAGQVTSKVNGNQVGAATPTSVAIVLSSTVFDGKAPLKAARVRIVELPELGTVETDNNGSFTFKGVHKKLNDKVRIRVEHDGYRTEEFPVTIGKYLLPFSLEKMK